MIKEFIKNNDLEKIISACEEILKKDNANIESLAYRFYAEIQLKAYTNATLSLDKYIFNSIINPYAIAELDFSEYSKITNWFNYLTNGLDISESKKIIEQNEMLKPIIYRISYISFQSGLLSPQEILSIYEKWQQEYPNDYLVSFYKAITGMLGVLEESEAKNIYNSALKNIDNIDTELKPIITVAWQTINE